MTCAVTVLAGGVSSASASVACSEISGAGSSLQNIAQKEVWIGGFKGLGCTAEPTIKYFATSSGKGEAQWGDNATQVLKDEEGVSPFPAFIGTDIGPEGSAGTSKTQLNNIDTAGSQGTGAGEGVVTVPVAQSAIAILVSLPEGCTATSNATAKVKSADLETEWFKNEGELGSLVKGAGVVCAHTPKLYARESASGTTAGFKRYLDDLETAHWGAFVSTAAKAANTEWPGTVEKTGFSKGSQLAEGVFNKPGSNGAIGYADLADALKAGFTTKVVKHTVEGKEFYSFLVQVQRNAKGAETPEYASPASSNASNCGNAAYNSPATVGPNVDWSGAKQNNVESTTTYSICTLTFDLAWHEYSKPKKEGSAVYNEEKYNSAFNYLSYIVNGGQNATLEANHYGKLTEPVTKETQTGVSAANIKF
jgi:hypothetical protein